MGQSPALGAERVLRADAGEGADFHFGLSAGFGVAARNDGAQESEKERHWNGDNAGVCQREVCEMQVRENGHGGAGNGRGEHDEREARDQSTVVPQSVPLVLKRFQNSV